MEVLSSTKECSSSLSSPYSSPNLTSLLKIKIISWSQETGLPVTARVRVGGKSFNLHKSLLMAKSGYFKRQLSEWQEVELPEDFPGGSKTFEMIVLFIYGSSTFIDPFNVTSLRCASEFLEMTEAYAFGNLCERTDLYLTQVALQSWDDTLIVLQKCQSVLPWSEQVLIVSRCIESLAFMACMEILDPERKRDNRNSVSLETLTALPWSSLALKEVIVSQDLWIKDLIALPFRFFKRVVGSLRRQGMKEKYVSPIILFYANRWVISKTTRQFWEYLCDQDEDENKSDYNDISRESQRKEMLQGILELLPWGEKARRVIPVGFYFAMLARSLELGGGRTILDLLKEKIVIMLPLAHAQDFLLPKKDIGSISSSVEVGVMESIFSTYFSSTMETELTPSTRGCTIVAELWDMYLSRLACYPTMEPMKFVSLVENVPLSHRTSHDHLYKAMNSFLKAHPNLSQDEKASICKYLNCQKLSQEVCIEAVQNEFMPLRLIVQALFIQQLNTQQAFKECSDSFRFANSGELSGSISGSRLINSPTSNSKSQGDLSLIMDGDASHEMTNKPLGCFLETDNDNLKLEIAENEYESTSFRIQNLELELLSLKKTLNSKKRVAKVKDQVGSKRHAIGHVSGCIGSVNFGSHKNYVSSFLKIIQKMTIFRRVKQWKQSNVTTS